VFAVTTGRGYVMEAYWAGSSCSMRPADSVLRRSSEMELVRAASVSASTCGRQGLGLRIGLGWARVPNPNPNPNAVSAHLRAARAVVPPHRVVPRHLQVAPCEPPPIQVNSRGSRQTDKGILRILCTTKQRLR
jgi:hypothetical protein